MDAAVAAAADKQAAKATTQDAVLAQDIETAPAAELASGDGDVSTTGAALKALLIGHTAGAKHKLQCPCADCHVWRVCAAVCMKHSCLPTSVCSEAGAMRI